MDRETGKAADADSEPEEHAGGSAAQPISSAPPGRTAGPPDAAEAEPDDGRAEAITQPIVRWPQPQASGWRGPPGRPRTRSPAASPRPRRPRPAGPAALRTRPHAAPSPRPAAAPAPGQPGSAGPAPSDPDPADPTAPPGPRPEPGHARPSRRSPASLTPARRALVGPGTALSRTARRRRPGPRAAARPAGGNTRRAASSRCSGRSFPGSRRIPGCRSGLPAR